MLQSPGNRPIFTSPPFNLNGVGLKDLPIRKFELSEALKRSGVHLPEIPDCRPRFESGI